MGVTSSARSSVLDMRAGFVVTSDGRLPWGRAWPSGPRVGFFVTSVVVLSDEKCFARDEYFDWGVTTSVMEEVWVGGIGRGVECSRHNEE